MTITPAAGCVERWSDELPDERWMWDLYLSGIRTVITHGGPLAPFVECEDKLSLADGVFQSNRRLTVRKPAEFIKLEIKDA